MAQNIIGISAHYHDASCCLLRDGELVAAVSEERITRVKHDPALPIYGIRSCLAQAGLGIDEIDCVAYYEEPVAKLARQLWMGLPGVPEPRLERNAWMEVGRATREIRELLGYEGELRLFDHHRSHAASSYYFSGFDDAAILTVDGVGEWACASYGRGRGDELELLQQIDFPDSLGLLYSMVTGYLGFRVNNGEYKVMGLAPYGEPKYVDSLRRLIRLEGGGRVRLDMAYFDFLRGDRMYSDKFVELLGRPPRGSDAAIEQFHEDVAKSLQVVLEDSLLFMVEHLHAIAPSANLCMAGGVALNCVANARILRDGPFERLFVQPAASDAGSALGAAMLAHVALGGAVPRRQLAHVYLGRGFDPEDVGRALVASGIEFADFRGDAEGLCEAVAARLVGGQVVGWFQGREEFGPRALGARSILADPRVASMREHVNALVKKREGFRPFAPAVLTGRAAEFFELDHPSPFMLETCQVRAAIEMPAITHVDGSARVQTVEPEDSPLFARLLATFERLTGCPVLLNTSFNQRGEPIVGTFVDAIRCFVRTDLDALVLGDYVIDRAALPNNWLKLRMTGVALDRSVGEHIYTFF